MAMANIQPDAYDLIVLGTGLEEALIAAAASLAGLSVLHLDPQPEYGSQWAGLTLDRFLEWAEQQQAPLPPGTPQPEESEHAAEQRTDAPMLELPLNSTGGSIYSGVEVHRRQDADLGSLGQFTIDQAPKLLYTVGPMVESLLRCKADNYLVFRLVHSFVWRDGKIRSVPASRADIFKDRSLSPSDKRILMRFLKNTVDALNGEGPLKDAFHGRPFAELLGQEGLPLALQQATLYCLAMLSTAQSTGQPVTAGVDQPTGSLVSTDRGQQGQYRAHAAAVQLQDRQAAAQVTAGGGDAASTSGAAVAEAMTAEVDKQKGGAVSIPNMETGLGASTAASTSGSATAEAGLALLSRYVESVSRFGGAFMTPDYGSGELPQAFCRVAAVHGAVYVLRCGVRSLLLDAEGHRCQGLRTAAGQVLRCTALAANCDLLPASYVHASPLPEISRGVAILDRPLQQSEAAPGSGRTSSTQMLLTVPPSGIRPGIPLHPVRVLQLGQQSLVAPAGRVVLHLSTVSSRRGGGGGGGGGGSGGAAAELQPVLSSLLRSDSSTSENGKTSTSSGPETLFTAFYSQSSRFLARGTLPQNVALCQPPDEQVAYQAAVAGAEAAFKRLFPDRDFLPALPVQNDAYDSD